MKQTFTVFKSQEESLNCGSNEKLARHLFNELTSEGNDAVLVIEDGSENYFIETVWSDGFVSMKQINKFFHIKERAS